MKKYAGYVIAAVSVIVAVIGLLVLPDVVVSKISATAGNTTMSKYPAMLLPAALTVAFGCIGAKGENAKYTVVALILLLAESAMLILNLTVFA